ncbi:outer membrane beta-barrel protein [uncultured Rhodospira sp.]|uniref:OmpA family protein n=1 Tax=uncultured Rhodospira sp. TaxID=1936189 RepID=UPI00260EE89D|nr:outer membrane beta-barrel protein [uncultured Rhodospira sp.]
MRANGQRRVAGCTAIVLGLALSAPAAAERVPEGPYFGAGGGLNLNDSGDLDSGGVGRELDTDLGFVGLASFGYAFGNGVRTEIEGGYRQNWVDSWGGTGVDGTLSAWHGMVNALYDFETHSPFTPYVGVGLGAAVVSVDADNRSAGIDLDDTEVGLAYQAIVGMGYDVAENLAITADYRFFHVIDPDHVLSDGDGGGPSDTYLNHTFALGLRYAFGTPPQPAAASPAPTPEPMDEPPPAVPTSYLVFFGFDSATLTPEAISIVDTAASNAKQVGPTRIEVTGHTDRAGPSKYNLILSQQRAKAVMDRLIAQGVPLGDIAVFAKGEDEPLIPTADGVIEAQNRRVEIILL